MAWAYAESCVGVPVFDDVSDIFDSVLTAPGSDLAGEALVVKAGAFVHIYVADVWAVWFFLPEGREFCEVVFS